jgi:preprotein translocase subunit YajC
LNRSILENPAMNSLFLVALFPIGMREFIIIGILLLVMLAVIAILFIVRDRKKNTSRQQRLHHLTAHIREPVISSGEAIGELFVIEAELMQHCRVQIGHGDFVLDGAVAELIRRAVDHDRL